MRMRPVVSLLVPLSVSLMVACGSSGSSDLFGPSETSELTGGAPSSGAGAGGTVTTSAGGTRSDSGGTIAGDGGSGNGSSLGAGGEGAGGEGAGGEGAGGEGAGAGGEGAGAGGEGAGGVGAGGVGTGGVGAGAGGAGSGGEGSGGVGSGGVGSGGQGGGGPSVRCGEAVCGANQQCCVSGSSHVCKAVGSACCSGIACTTTSVTCDGQEDCSGSAVCCANLSTAAIVPWVSSIKCQSSCSTPFIQYVMCDSNGPDVCPTGTSCSATLLVSGYECCQ